MNVDVSIGHTISDIFDFELKNFTNINSQNINFTNI